MRDAVLVGALFGPMQVAGRHRWSSPSRRRMRAIAVGTIAFAVLAVALRAAHAGARRSSRSRRCFAALYGWANGVMTIVRGTVPAELFGATRYGALLGRLARPQFVARAIAPLAVAAVLAIDPAAASRWRRSRWGAWSRSSPTAVRCGG